MSEAHKTNGWEPNDIPEIPTRVKTDKVGRGVVNLDNIIPIYVLDGTEEDVAILEAEEAIINPSDSGPVNPDYHFYINPSRIVRKGVIEASDSTRMHEVVRTLSANVPEYESLTELKAKRSRDKYTDFMKSKVSVPVTNTNGEITLQEVSLRDALDINKVLNELMSDLKSVNDPVWQLLEQIRSSFEASLDTEDLARLVRLTLTSLKLPELEDIFTRSINELLAAKDD